MIVNTPLKADKDDYDDDNNNNNNNNNNNIHVAQIVNTEQLQHCIP